MMMPPGRCPTYSLMNLPTHSGRAVCLCWTGKDAGALEDWGQGQLAGKEAAGP